MSYAMRVKKHTAHHQNPNTKGNDPDIHTVVVAFHQEGADSKRGLPPPSPATPRGLGIVQRQVRVGLLAVLEF